MGFLDESRQVTFDWHIVQAKKWLEYGEDRTLDSPLVYAALELRSAIERYFVELALLLNDGNLSPKQEKQCRSMKGIEALLRDIDTHYRQTFQFTRILVSVMEGAPEITIVDTAFLKRRWQELSEYCHKHMRPENSFDSSEKAFQREGYRLLVETIGRFTDFDLESNCGIISPSSMPDEVRDLYQRFVDGEVDAALVATSLRLMEPVLTARLGRAFLLR